MCPVSFKLACCQSPRVPPVVVRNFTNTHAASQLDTPVEVLQDAFHVTLNVTVVLPPERVPTVGLVTLILVHDPSLAERNMKSDTNRAERWRANILFRVGSLLK